MNPTFLENKGHYRTSIDGTVIDEAKWNVDYDGKTANLEAEKNGETVYMKLTNDDIMKLMNTNVSPYSIEERLLHDKQHKPDVSPILLKMDYHRNKKSNDKGTKSKSTRKHKSKKHSRTKTSKSKTSKSKTSKSKTKKQRLSKSKSKSKSKPSKINETIPDYMRTIY